ncbi:MAG: tRNA (N6-threonylcarbamoyladenosine(37)-N6)-methyltransferase TrmO [Desulfobulbaceae bacterium]|nr:tRNA (N6-threonylcarbamoyladenosine(37)-N6)-methyltransferase TrmO [Desulfobulbaceae bacterium]
MTKRQQFTTQPIGVVHCQLQTREETPKNYSESSVTGQLEIYPEYREGLQGLQAGQTILVLFWLHEARRDLLQVYPRGDQSRGLQGVFTTRSPVRPNPIAVSELKVLAVRDLLLEVAGLDVLNGTPILDIKRSLAAGGAQG